MADQAHQPIQLPPPDEEPRRGDWVTPLMLTLTVHLMVFTLIINHRLFGLMDEPRPGISVLGISQIIGTESDTDPGTDPGAAPGEPAAKIGASISDLVHEQTPVLPRGEVKPDKPIDTPQKTDPSPSKSEGRTLAERLQAAMDSAGGGGEGDTVALPPGGGSHGLRGKGRHGTGLTSNGGSSETENAVELGLAWLASVQDSDGRWDSNGFMVHYLPNANPDERQAEGPGFSNVDIGLTGLSLLAFTGAGYTDASGNYRTTVKNAREFLLGRQRSDGGIGSTEDTGGVRPTLYDHALATLALLDLYQTSGDVKLLNPLQRAVKYMLALQQADGGWTYEQTMPGDAAEFHVPHRDDLSITGWCVMALASAREAGITVPQENLRRCVEMLKHFTRDDGEAIYSEVFAPARDPRAGERGMAMLAVSNVSRRLLGEDADSKTQARQLSRLAESAPDWTHVGNMSESSYMWYYGSIAMLLAKSQPGGENRWREWNIALKRSLVEHQEKLGGRRGSFEPSCFWAKNGGGRVYATAIAVLNLEIYYRYDPQYLRVNAAELNDLWK